MSVEEFIIWVYCCVDDYYRRTTIGQTLRSRGFAPALSDAEVITMELVGEFLGFDADKKIWEYFSHHWMHLFPQLGSRANFAKHAANLWCIKKMIHELIIADMGATEEEVHIIDGFPVPVCHYRRSGRSKIFKDVEAATYGYCASKKEKYYGFEGTIVVTTSGVITGYTFTKPNIEREASFECTQNIEGILLGDKGYLGEHYGEEMKGDGIQVSAPPKENMEDRETPSFRKYLNDTRRKVETVIGQLVDRFNISKVRARSLWHLTSRVTRKVLGHTIGMKFLQDRRDNSMALEHILSSNPA